MSKKSPKQSMDEKILFLSTLSSEFPEEDLDPQEREQFKRILKNSIEVLKLSKSRKDEERLGKLIKISIDRYHDLTDYLTLAQLYEYQNKPEKEKEVLKEIIAKFPDQIGYDLTYQTEQLEPQQILAKNPRLRYENSSRLGHSKSKYIEDFFRDIAGWLEKKPQEAPEACHLIAGILIEEDNYEGLKNLVEKIYATNPDDSFINKLLEGIVKKQNRDYKGSGLFECETFPNHQKLAKKLGLKQIKEQPGKKTAFIKGLYEIFKNLDNKELPLTFKEKRDKELKRINSEYQDLLIRILELKPETQEKIMKIRNLSNNYDKPSIANAYNHYLKTKDIDGTIKRLKNILKKEGYTLDVGITIAQLYELKKEPMNIQKAWEDVIEHILSDKETKLSSTAIACAPKNEIAMYAHRQKLPFRSDNTTLLIFKKSSKKGELKKEEEAIKEFQKISLERKLGIEFPKVILSTQKEDCEYLIMEATGTTTAYKTMDGYERLKAEECELLKHIIKQIAKIHANFPTQLLKKTHSSKKEENDKRYSNKIKQKFFGNLKELIKQNNQGIKQKISSLIDKKEIEKEVKAHLKRGVEYYDELIKQIENGDFTVKGNAWMNFHYMDFSRSMMPIIRFGLVYPEGFFEMPLLERIDKKFSKEDYKKPLIELIKKAKEKTIDSLEKRIEEGVISEKKRTKSQKKELSNKKIKLSITPEQAFSEDYSVILDIISNLQEGVYKDNSLKNWVSYGSDDVHCKDDPAVIPIDYGTLRNSPYQFDIASAIEFIDYIDPDIRPKMLRIYFDTFNQQIEKYNLDKPKLENFNEFEKGYYASAVHRCLVHTGSSSGFFLGDAKKDDEYIKGCETFLNNAIRNIDGLKKYFKETSEDYKKLTNLEMYISKIKSLIESTTEGVK